MFAKNSLIVEVSIVLGLIGTFLLGGVFVLSKKYHKTVSNESISLNRTLNFIETSLSDKQSCINTLSNIKVSFTPQKIDKIQSTNNYTEFAVGAKISNIIFLKEMTLQQIHKEDNKMTVLLKIIFDNSAENKEIKYFRLFNVEYEKSHNKMINCVLGQKIIL